MKNFNCNCGATIFFENVQCVACNSEIAWCPACDTLRSINCNESGEYHCADPGCGAALTKCLNYSEEQVCNRCLLTENAPAEGVALCDYCQFNDTIPDLTVEGNRKKWREIEIAKRRLLYTLDLLNVPYGHAKDSFELPLSFDFKGDVSKKRLLWLNVNKGEQVYTGHADGKVTINIREADDVEREKARTSFGEAHRTIIGHFRHEMGHYYWDLLVKDKCELDCIEVFGDHNNPDYGAALEIYYENGPKPDWQKHYISGYATMHPWEDFAESFAAYLDMVSVVDIAFNARDLMAVNPVTASFAEISRQYTQLGLLLNEMNRAVGLLDLVPEVYTQSILNKIEFIHDLLRNS
ncbi:MAG: putative zinc-binding metallopeptidase [Gammaproteobacteria bacterium]